VGLDAFGGKEEKIDDDFLGYANLMVRRVFEVPYHLLFFRSCCDVCRVCRVRACVRVRVRACGASCVVAHACVV
jgi:hypothetical protein